MTPQRKEYLYRQYVLPLVNDSNWYAEAKKFLVPGDAVRFYQATYQHIKRLARDMPEGMPNGKERAYIYLECWHYHGGHTDAFFFNTSTTNSTMKYAAEIVAETAALKHSASQQPVSQPEPQKEEPVNPTTNTAAATAFETRHFVYGTDVNQLGESQLIDAIKRLESEIADLKSVKTESTKLAAKIKDLESMLAKVVEVLDAK